MRRAALLVLLMLSGCERETASGRGVTDGPLKKEFAIKPSLAGGEKLADIGAEGLRLLIQPSFGRYAYYLSFQRLPAGCVPRDRQPDDYREVKNSCGPARVHVRRTDQRDGTASRAEFYLPPEEADDFFEALDMRMARWRGSNAGGTDGTGVDLERVRGGLVKSMSSNASPSSNIDNPAAQLKPDALRVLLAYGPSGFAPRSSNWDVSGRTDESDPCNETLLAQPLDSGFGLGNSDCDASRRWP